MAYMFKYANTSMSLLFNFVSCIQLDRQGSQFQTVGDLLITARDLIALISLLIYEICIIICIEFNSRRQTSPQL